MKNNILYLLAIMLLPLVFGSCTDELYADYLSARPLALGIKDGSGAVLTVDQSLTFNASDDAAKTIMIKSANTRWQLDKPSGASWLNLSSQSGSSSETVSVTVEENLSATESRVAVLTLSSLEKEYPVSRSITVTQQKAVPYITLTGESTIAVDGKRQERSVGVKSNVEWTCRSSNESCASARRDGNAVTITIAENTEDARTAEIYLDYEGKTYATIRISQSAAGISASPSTLGFGVDGGRQQVNIESDAAWTAESSAISWLEAKPVSGTAGKTMLEITALANESLSSREGYIYINVGEKRKLSIKVEQEGIRISVDKTTIQFGVNSASETINITANHSWTAKKNADWITVNPENGTSGGQSVAISATDNPNTTPREGIVEIYSANSNLLCVTINVNQAGASFSDIVDRLDFPNIKSSQKLAVVTDGSWTAAASDSWIHLSPTSGKGNGELTIEVDANQGKEERKGNVTVSVGNSSQTVQIVQQGSYLNVNCDAVLTDSRPANIQISISSNTDWTAESSETWLTVNPKNGTGDAVINVSAADNPLISSRTATVTINSASDGKVLSFTQPGRSLSVSTQSITFEASGDLSKSITVTTDGAYEATTSDGWLKVSKSGNILTITADPNETTSARQGTVKVALTDLKDGKTLEKTISVQQKGDALVFEVTSNNTNLSNSKPATATISIICNSGWSITNPTSWLTLSKTSGNGDAKIDISVADNPSISNRNSKISIEADGVVKSVEITQPGRSLSVSKSSITFEANGGTSESITVTTDGTYEATTSDGWLKISKSGNTFTITADPNETTSARQGTVKVALTDLKDGKSLVKTIIVLQKSKQSVVDIDGFGEDENWN